MKLHCTLHSHHSALGLNHCSVRSNLGRLQIVRTINVTVKRTKHLPSSTARKIKHCGSASKKKNNGHIFLNSLQIPLLAGQIKKNNQIRKKSGLSVIPPLLQFRFRNQVSWRQSPKQKSREKNFSARHRSKKMQFSVRPKILFVAFGAFG